MRGRLLVVALFGAVALALGGSGAAAAACQQWTGAEPLSPGTDNDLLNGVTILGRCNVWAVGQTQGPGSTTLIEHWNGTAWRQVTSPAPGSGSSLMEVSPSWAVGLYSMSGGKSLVLRRAGNSWQQVNSPNPSALANDLFDVVQLSSRNAWAVGDLLTATAFRTLIIHWNGTKWKRVPSPNTGDDSTDNLLFGIEAHGANDIWAVGYRETRGREPAPDPALERGEVEGRVRPTLGDAPFGATLSDVAVDSAHAWAVGSYAVGSGLKGFILRWDGSKWKRVALPSFPLGTAIEGVTAISSRNVYAVEEENTKNPSCTGTAARGRRSRSRIQAPWKTSSSTSTPSRPARSGWSASRVTRARLSTRPGPCTAAERLAARRRTPGWHPTPRAEPGRGSCRSCPGRSGWPPRCRRG